MRIIGGIARGTKLFTLNGVATRPTLDRVKEPLFNIINFDLQDAMVLDLFAGSGALGLEAVSRGAHKSILCEKNKSAVNIIEKNINKTKFQDKVLLLKYDFMDDLQYIQSKKIKLDIVFLDPPYKTNLVYESLKYIIELDILNEDAILIVETDEPDRIKDKIKVLDINIFDERKYGRVSLLFLNQK